MAIENSLPLSMDTQSKKKKQRKKINVFISTKRIKALCKSHSVFLYSNYFFFTVCFKHHLGLQSAIVDASTLFYKIYTRDPTAISPNDICTE